MPVLTSVPHSVAESQCGSDQRRCRKLRARGSPVVARPFRHGPPQRGTKFPYTWKLDAFEKASRTKLFTWVWCSRIGGTRLDRISPKIHHVKCLFMKCIRRSAYTRRGVTMKRHDDPGRLTLGQVIRNRRIELGLTQEAFAERVGDNVRQSEISRLERDHIVLPRRNRLEAIARALDVTPGHLLIHSGWMEADEDIATASSSTDPASLPSWPRSEHGMSIEPFDTAVNAPKDILVVVDGRGAIVLQSQSFTDLFVVEPGKLRTLLDGSGIPLTEQQTPLGRTTCSEMFTMTFHCVAPEGVLQRFEATGRPVFDSGDPPMKVISIRAVPDDQDAS